MPRWAFSWFFLQGTKKTEPFSPQTFHFFVFCIQCTFYENKNNENTAIQKPFFLLYSLDFGNISKDKFSTGKAIKGCTEKWISNLVKIFCVRLQATQQREINQGHLWCIGTCGPLKGRLSPVNICIEHPACFEGVGSSGLLTVKQNFLLHLTFLSGF